MHVHHPNDLGPDAKVSEVQKAIQVLMEHFEAVQILGSYCDDQGQTINIYNGQGNWFARQGMAADFLNKDQAQTQAHEMKRVLPPPAGDEGEEWKE